MPRTNATVSLFRESKDWQGNITRTALGDYDVYLEEYAQREIRKIDGSGMAIAQSRGFFILFYDLSCENLSVAYGGDTFSAFSWARFTFPRSGRFHHTEVEYR